MKNGEKVTAVKKVFLQIDPTETRVREKVEKNYFQFSPFFSPTATRDYTLLEKKRIFHRHNLEIKREMEEKERNNYMYI